jgi:hypothetical protein
MSWFRRIVLFLGILATVSLAVAGHYYYKGSYRLGRIRHNHPAAAASLAAERMHIGQAEYVRIGQVEYKRIGQKVLVEKPWLLRHGFNTHLCFLADMRLPSGKNRFFVCDLDKDSLILSGLVAHGCGGSTFSATPTFSNVNGSSCTALGRYRVGYPYQGQFGRAYKLYGLDSSNDQAFARNIVLHSYAAVPAAETNPYPICNSRGCPMVSPAFFQQLQALIDGSKKPILLWIFD